MSYVDISWEGKGSTKSSRKQSIHNENFGRNSRTWLQSDISITQRTCNSPLLFHGNARSCRDDFIQRFIFMISKFKVISIRKEIIIFPSQLLGFFGWIIRNWRKTGICRHVENCKIWMGEIASSFVPFLSLMRMIILKKISSSIFFLKEEFRNNFIWHIGDQLY